jgi:SAM-dependent methyltransferase
MLEVARRRAHGAGLKLGAAEELPFKDGWFERAAMWLVVHLLDGGARTAELHRVLAPDGRLAIATFDPTYFDDFWLNHYFPSMEAADRATLSHRGGLREPSWRRPGSSRRALAQGAVSGACSTRGRAGCGSAASTSARST